MSVFIPVAGAIFLGLLVYLSFALLFPERLS